jgi:hypothetical protein
VDSTDELGEGPTVPGTTAETLPPSLVNLAESGIVSPAAVAKTALRYEYAGADELLAWMASAGRLPLAEILRLARAHADGALDDATLVRLKAPALYALAFLAVGTADDDAAIGRAADLFALARSTARRTGARTQHPDMDMQAAFSAGRHAYVRAHLARSSPWVRWAVSADLANPFPDARPAELAAWLKLFNKPFAERGLAPVLVEGVGAPFDSLTSAGAETRARTIDGPLVTIVVSVFKPTASLLGALRSLVEQTWRNLQIVLVDDASPEEYEPVFAQARALDERIEYVRTPVNGGAYRARNFGITHARGEYVGFHDSDDWSHPERIERQVRVFDTQPGVVATLSKAVWLYSDLRITRPGTQPFARIAPSLIFRREQVLERLGPFDDLRRAADTEFIERLATVFGREAVVTLDEPLSLYQLTAGSLSRADFRVGWHRDARVSYHSAFRHWHRQIAENHASPVIESPEGRAFPAPPELIGVPYPPEPLDVVVLADWRAGPVEYTGLPAEVEALAGAGLSVGLARGEAIRHATVGREYPSEAILDVLAEGRASWAPLGADLAPRVLLVRDPQLMALSRAASAVAMKPERVIVAAAQPPGSTYEPRRVEQVVRELFGRKAEWLPSTRDVAVAVTSAGATGIVHPSRLTGVANIASHPWRPVDGRPVIGVAAAARHTADLPQRQDLTRLLPTDDDHDVRVVEAPSRRTAHPTWLGIGLDQAPASEFLDQCDFYVGLPAMVRDTTLVRPVLDAMARGCVPIVHPSFRPLLGDAAIYYGDRSVAEIVDELWSDPAAFAAHQKAALSFCHNELSASAFAATISQLTTTEPPP